MGRQSIPVNHNVSFDLSDEMMKELKHFAATNGFSWMQSKEEIARGRNHADGADVCPVVRVGQHRRHANGRPGSMDEGCGVESTFIPESDGDLTRYQFF